MTFHEQITNDALALYDKDSLPREKLEFIQRELLTTDAKYNSLLTRYQELEQKLENMRCCSNCKHFNNVEDLEYCQNCERQLVNSLDKLPREEIIKDEWELKEVAE